MERVEATAWNSWSHWTYWKRKKQEAEERKRQEAECKRDEQTRQSRFQSVLIRFINEGHSSLGKFSQTERINFNDKEANAIYYGLIATAVNDRLSLNVSKNIEASVNKFLAGMTWNGCTEFRRECVSNWTKLFATKDVTYTKDTISNFLSFVDHMSCSCRHIRLAWRLKRMRWPTDELGWYAKDWIRNTDQEM